MKGLDWTNETWVRLYRSDSPAWKRLKWEAQSVYLALLRKIDRAGCLCLDGLLDFEAVAEMTGCPEDVAERALPRLYQLGFLVKSEDGDLIVDPEYIDRDEAASSDAQRKRDSRSRRRDRGVSRIGTDESQNVTKTSHAVTRGHTRSLLDKPILEEKRREEPPLPPQGGTGGEDLPPLLGGPLVGPEGPAKPKKRSKAEEDADRVIEAYDRLRPGWCEKAGIKARGITWGPRNRKLLRACLAEHTADEIIDALEAVPADPFLMGKGDYQARGPALAPEDVFKINGKIDKVQRLLERKRKTKADFFRELGA